MLMDMLGILTGFVSIMLLFSLLTTALVQGAQAAMNLRFKNFKAVISHFLNNMNFVEHQNAKTIMELIEKRFSGGLYATALPIKIPANRINITGIGEKELIGIINDTPNMSIEHKEQLKNKVQDHFYTVEEIMSQRFKQWMHQLSILLAFIICFVFQLNCFNLLQQLNEDTTFRYQTQLIATQLESNSSTFLESPSNPSQLNGHLQALNFKITPENWSHYYFSLSFDTLSHWLGIIFSSILISLGAPFWFNRLKDMASLRDKLSKTQK